MQVYREIGHLRYTFAGNFRIMDMTTKHRSASDGAIESLGSVIPEQLAEETEHAYARLNEALGGDTAGFVANRLQMSPEELSIALAAEQVDGVALAIYNIEARGQSVIIGDQTGIGKGRQAAAMIRYGMLAGYLPIFLTDRYTLFSDMYRDCKALGIKDARPLIVNTSVSIVDFDKPIEDKSAPLTDEIWSPEDDEEDDEDVGLYAKHYEEIYKSPKKKELDLIYRNGDIPTNTFEYVMLTYSQLKDARRDMTRLDFLTSLCEKHRVLFIFDEAHKSSSVSAGKISIITQGINSILDACPDTQCVFLSATFAKRPECLITFMRQTVLTSLATNETLQQAFANGGVQMQEYVASKLAGEGQMIRREHSGEGIPEPVYTYLDDKLPLHSELFDKVMYWFRELVNLSDMVKELFAMLALQGVEVFRPYPTRAQLFYVNKVLLLSLKARDVAETAVREVQAGRSVVIGMSDTLECVLRDSIDPLTSEAPKGDFSTILLRLLDKTLRNPKNPAMTVFDVDLTVVGADAEIQAKIDEISLYVRQIREGIQDDTFHLPMSPIDVIRQLITQECFTGKDGVTRNIRFEECTGRAHQLEYLSPEGDDEFVNISIIPRKKRHSNHIYNDFQNNKLDVILINACGAIGASAHAVATVEIDEADVRQRKMLIVQNDLDVNIDLQKRGRINRTGQIKDLPPLYEYIITAIPSEKRLNMMLRAKLRSLSANTTANQDQDKRQADFIDITNKYGNIVTQEFIAANQELAFVLGLSKSTTASQLLARISMLSVTAQQDIIEEVFGAYQNLEQELRRINQWDLEREYRDFEAEFVKEELFTASIDDSAIGGASMLSTFRCRHRTYPYDAAALYCSFEEAKSTPYGRNLSESEELKKDIEAYYRAVRKNIRNKINARKEKLFDTTLSVLLRYGVEEHDAKQFILMAQRPAEVWDMSFFNSMSRYPKHERIKRKLKSYNKDLEDLDAREKKELEGISTQRKRLMTAISMAVVGQGYWDIKNQLPVEEEVGRVMAVLKGIRFGKNPRQRFQPGKVQFVFALSALHKELVLNLVDKGSQNNYDLLTAILSSPKWNFNGQMWDSEIAKYNNRILDRQIITGNILGAFANPLIQKMKPHFITFSLSPVDGSTSKTERGLLLPMTGENVEKLISNVTLPLGYGLKYATALNHVYQISGIGLDFSISPVLDYRDMKNKFYISIVDKDSRKFETDTRFDAIRDVFKVTQVTSIHNKNNIAPKRPLMRYATESLKADSPEFASIMTLLASLRAVILIPREYLTVGEMKDFANLRTIEDNSQWPELDWRHSAQMPPAKREVQVRISAPVVKDDKILYTDELPLHITLCNRTLAYQGRSFKEVTIPGQMRALYLQWHDLSLTPTECEAQFCWNDFTKRIADEIHWMLINSTKEPVIQFSDYIFNKLKEVTGKHQLSAVGRIIARYRDEMLFTSPPKNVAEKFLDECLCDPRLATIRTSVENYLKGKTDLITDL